LFPITHRADLKLDQEFEPNHVAYSRRELFFHSKVVGKGDYKKLKKEKVNLMRLEFDGIMMMHYVSKERRCGG